MNRALKITGIAFGAAIGLIVVLVAALLLLIDPNDYKPEIAALVKKKTDMDLVIADKLAWELWPNIGVKLGKTSLTDSAAKETLVAVEQASVSVELMPLLSKNIQIDAVNLDGAKIRFIQHADGSTSWDRMLAKLASAPKDDSESVAFNIKKLNIKNTAALMLDEKTNTTRSVSDVVMQASNIGMDKNFPLHLAFTFTQQQEKTTLVAKNNLDTQIKIDQKKQQYTLSDLSFNSALSGNLLPLTADATISIKGSVLADMLAQKINLQKISVAATYPAQGLSAPATVQLNTDVIADLGKTLLSINGLAVSVSWPDATRPAPITANVKAALATNWSDGAINASEFSASAALPDKNYPNPLQVAYQSAFTANFMQGTVVIPAFVLSAAGTKTTGNFSGSFPAVQSNEPKTAITAGMLISGAINTAAFNPRAVMAALGMAAPVTSDAGVLKSASMSATMQGNEKNIIVKNIAMKLDNSTFTGEAGIADLSSMRQYARLSVDTLNADRYLPPASASSAAASSSTSTSAEKTSASAAANMLPVALIKSLNMDAAFNAGALTILQYPINNFRVATTANAGVVNVSELKGGIFSGTFSVPVNINVQGAQPVITTQPKWDHIEIQSLAKKLLNKDLVAGKTSYTGNLTLRGNSVDEWMRSVSGSSNLTLDNGLLHGVNAMKELTAALGKYQGLLALAGKDADTLASKQKDTEIASFTTNNTLTNGVVNSTLLNADLKKAKVAGTGTFNLLTQSVDYKFTLTLDKSVGGDKAAAYALPVICKGSLAGNMASLCQLDAKAITAMATKAAAMKGLEKLGLKGLGDKTPEGAVKEKAAEETQKAKDKLTEKLNEKLNNLFKR